MEVRTPYHPPQHEDLASGAGKTWVIAGALFVLLVAAVTLWLPSNSGQQLSGNVIHSQLFQQSRQLRAQENMAGITNLNTTTSYLESLNRAVIQENLLPNL